MVNDYNTFVYKQNVYPMVKTNMDKNSRLYLNYISKYVDKNSEILFDNGISKRPYFGGEDINILYKITGTQEKDLKYYIKESRQTKQSWVIFNKPENWIMTLLIKYFMDKKDEKNLDKAIMYFALSFYPSIHYNAFPKGLPNENVMDYTINTLSNKYDIKRLGSLFKAMYKIAKNCHIKYADTLKDENICDRYILEYIMYMRTRIKNFVIEIADKYYENLENKHYMNYDSENRSDNGFYEVDNISFVVERLAGKVTNEILSSSVDIRIAEMSAKICKVSTSSVKSAIHNIIQHESQNIKIFNTKILQEYLVVLGNEVYSIGSTKFINECDKMYSKSNTNNENIIVIKEILDRWLSQNCEKYIKVERAATKSSFRRAVFLYFVFVIQKIYSNR